MKLGVAAILVGSTSYTYASGFQLFEQNGAWVGDYDAGGAAEASDASTAWYNPAGLVRLDHTQLVLGAAGVDAGLSFEGEAQNYTTATINAPLPPHNPETIHVLNYDAYGTAEGGTFAVIPSFHLAVPLSNSVVAALSVVVPFGLESDWPDDSIVRYSATETSIEDVDITPSLGVKITDKFSIGAGIDFQHVDAVLDQIVGFGDVVPNSDSHSENDADDWALGWHGGVLYQFTPHTRVGLAYHSQVNVDADGTSKFYGPLATYVTGGQTDTLVSHDLNAQVTLPGYATLSIFHDINARWAVKASANYTEWSKFDTIPLNNVAAIGQVDGTLQPQILNVNVPQNFHNTWRFATGVNFKQTEKWMWRAGVGVDQDPTNDEDRNLRLPDGNVFAIAVGAHYQLNKAFGFDAGYQHLFTKDGEINNAEVVGAQTAYVNGDTKNTANLFSLQMTVNFGTA